MLLFVQDGNKNWCAKAVKIYFPFFLFVFCPSIAMYIKFFVFVNVHVEKKAFHIVFEIPFRKSRSRKYEKFIMWNANMKKNRDCYRYRSESTIKIKFNSIIAIDKKTFLSLILIDDTENVLSLMIENRYLIFNACLIVYEIDNA